jgi:hypothetical protein
MHLLASMLRSGTSSTHLVDLSMTVKGTRDHLKMPEEDPPGPRVRWRTKKYKKNHQMLQHWFDSELFKGRFAEFVLRLGWRGVEL